MYTQVNFLPCIWLSMQKEHASNRIDHWSDPIAFLWRAAWRKSSMTETTRFFPCLKSIWFQHAIAFICFVFPYIWHPTQGWAYRIPAPILNGQSTVTTAYCTFVKPTAELGVWTSTFLLRNTCQLPYFTSQTTDRLA